MKSDIRNRDFRFYSVMFPNFELLITPHVQSFNIVNASKDNVLSSFLVVFIVMGGENSKTRVGSFDPMPHEDVQIFFG